VIFEGLTLYPQSPFAPVDRQEWYPEALPECRSRAEFDSLFFSFREIELNRPVDFLENKIFVKRKRCNINQIVVIDFASGFADHSVLFDIGDGGIDAFAGKNHLIGSPIETDYRIKILFELSGKLFEFSTVIAPLGGCPHFALVFSFAGHHVSDRPQFVGDKLIYHCFVELNGFAFFVD